MKGKFYLDLSDDMKWLIKRGEECYIFGTDKEKAEKLIERLNAVEHVHIRQYHTVRLFIYWNYKFDPVDIAQNGFPKNAEIIEII